MRTSKRICLTLGFAAVVVTTVVLASGPELRKQTLAPHELNAGDAPPPILRETPPLPKGNINFDSAEEAHLKAVIITKGLQQPWSVAFLPDGAMLVTERAGRLRIIRNGVPDHSAVAGVPPVQTGGPRGLQGLMDVVLHPHFRENGWVYLAYHRPTGGESGETVLARGTWNGSALVDVKTIFESGATDTEASRIAFGRDGMLYARFAKNIEIKPGRSCQAADRCAQEISLRGIFPQRSSDERTRHYDAIPDEIVDAIGF